MVSIEWGFSEPVPGWISDVKAEATITITSARFAAYCRNGNQAVMRGLIIGLWPFIDEFPISMIRGAVRLPRIGVVEKRELLRTFLHQGPQIIRGIRRDEENHRKLWLQTGKALGLRFPEDFKRPTLSETQAWIDAINAECDPSTLLLRFAAIEMIAEIVSIDLLASTTFTSILGKDGCEWFRVHADHAPGMTHEELELRLAFALGEGSSVKEHAASEIMHIVKHAVAAMEASRRVGSE
jgi:pyrroloquinoline quinone (PQQ) biosynthesis protein C